MIRRHVNLLMMALPLLVMLVTAQPAGATLIVETLQGVGFYDGGTATGSFIFDTVGGTVTWWSISVAGGDTGTFPPFTYTTVNSTAAAGMGELGFPLTAFTFSAGDRHLRMLLENTLPPGGGTDPFHIWPNGQGGHGAGFECFNCAPFRNFSSGSLSGVLIPEPATVALVGCSLLGLAWRRRRRGSGVWPFAAQLVA